MSLRGIKILPVLLVLLLVFLQYRLWFQTGGIVEMMRLKKAVALQQNENNKLKKRNDALVVQIGYLQKNQDAVESRARRELGMIKKGETFYQVVN